MTNRRAPYNQVGAVTSGGVPIPLAGDVNGPSNANHVDTLTGPGTGIVTLANGTKIQSAIGTVGDLVNAAANVATFGNNTTVPSTNLFAVTNITLQCGGGIIDLQTNGDIFENCVITHFRTSGGGEIARFTMAEGTLQMFNAADPAAPVGGPKMYAVGGALKAIGTGGTITTMAPA